ncbi:MAG TPA: 2-oxoglutarate dehydrogenase, E2 component, dihydrolipoamide succinyltransferase, partial [Solibacterales bacterium]|nr:2-oxoglutarate dehydrogenase, E2 component, dihydrolipoamide succinyltransferase [Bryobacterales bacterium]
PAAPPPPTATPEETGPLSPLVRRMVREHNLDVSLLKGTGAGGRVTKSDVENYLAARAGQAPAPAVAAAPAPAAPAPALPPPPP